MQPKVSTKETLTGLVLEFVEAAVHQFLFARQVYPKEAFTQRVLYDVPIHMNRHPLLCEYIHSMLAGCRPWIHSGELEKLCVVLLSKEGCAIETLVIEPGWNQSLAEPAPPEEKARLLLVQLEEAFRTAMVALVAAPGTTLTEREHGADTHTFRILAHTMENMSNHGAAVAKDDAANSWVPADPFWCKEQSQEKQLFPVKTIRDEACPIAINVYMEKP